VRGAWCVVRGAWCVVRENYGASSHFVNPLTQIFMLEVRAFYSFAPYI